MLGRIEARAVEKQDRLGRDSEPLLQRIEADPTEPALYVQLASVYRRHNQLDRARAVFSKAWARRATPSSFSSNSWTSTSPRFARTSELAEARLRRLKEKSTRSEEETASDNGGGRGA